MSWRSAVAAGLAVVAAAAAVGVAGSETPHPTQQQVAPQVRPVTSATLSCPAATGSGSPATSVFAVAPAPAGGSTGAPAAGASRLTVTGASTVAAAQVDSVTTSTPGVPVRATVIDTRPAGSSGGNGTGSGVLVSAGGALAPGATAAQWSTYRGPSTSGIAAGWCLSPRGDWWFSGVDTSVGTTTGLVLSNPSPAVAVVDLAIFGPAGVIDAAGSHGIPVAPRSRAVLDLARYAPGHTALTVHVTATRGTVAAAVSTTRLDGVTPTGAEWVPASASPAPAVVVNAGVADVDSQALVITNPGARQELVSVTILDKDGAFSSTALSEVQVPPGSVVVKDITAITPKQATAIRLSAPAAVTGAIISEQSRGVRDFAVSSTSDPLGAPSVVPTIPGTALTIAFATANPAPTAVTVRQVDRLGNTIRSSVVQVKGAATTTWTLPTGTGASYVEITVPSGGGLQAVASYSATAGVTQLPVLSGRWTVRRPVVLP